MKTSINCTIEIDIKKEAQKLGLGFSEALEFGLLFRQAEREDCLYPHNLLSNRVEGLADKLANALRRIEELEAKIKIDKKNDN